MSSYHFEHNQAIKTLCKGIVVDCSIENLVMVQRNSLGCQLKLVIDCEGVRTKSRGLSLNRACRTRQ